MKKMISIALICAMMLVSTNATAALIGGGSLKNTTPAPSSSSMGIGSGIQTGTKEEKSVGMSIGSKPQSEPTKSTGMGLGIGKKDTPAQTAEPAIQATSVPAPTEQPVNTDLEALKEIWLNPNPYYYPQLSDAHKAAWEKNIENVLTYPQQTKAASQDRRYQALASMIKIDNPRLFWIDWIDSYARLRFETGSNATYAPLEIPGGKTLEQMQDAFLAGIDKAVSEIGKNISAKSDTRAKAKSIHDWICRNNSYNYSQTTNHKKDHDPVSFAYLAAHSAYSAIIADDEYQPLCEGYAAAFQLLCHEFGVPCISVAGGANFSGTHVWNYVQLEDGKWYLVDATGDDVEKNGVAYVHQLFLATQGQVAKYAYEPFPYLFSGVNPENGYTEGAEFTFPELAK